MATRSAPRDFATSHRPAFRAALLAPRFWGTWAGWLGLWLLRFLPGAVRGLLSRVLADVVLRVPSGKRKYALRNLRACFPDLDEPARLALLRRHARMQLEVYLGFGELMFASRERLLARFDVHGLDMVKAASASGRGVMLLAPHTCAFEWAAQCVAILNPVVSMARLHKDNPAVDWIVNRMRLRFGGVVFGNEQSMVPLIKAVRAGYWMFYLPDEDRRNTNGVFAPFFGVPKLTIPTIGRLATACRAQVFPLQVRYLPETRRIRLDFLPALDAFPTGDPVLDATRMNAVIETMLAPDPAQYAWTQRIFRTRPPGSSNIYGAEPPLPR
jgi:lauroyl-KDO2-lipid IV(A) myristoyltransferase